MSVRLLDHDAPKGENKDTEGQSVKDKLSIKNSKYNGHEFVPGMFDVCGPPLQNIMPVATICQFFATILLPFLTSSVSSCIGKDEMCLSHPKLNFLTLASQDKTKHWIVQNNSIKIISFFVLEQGRSRKVPEPPPKKLGAQVRHIPPLALVCLSTLAGHHVYLGNLANMELGSPKLIILLW